MTKLYLVTETFPYEGGCMVYGIFSSKEFAEARLEEVRKRHDAHMSEHTLDEKTEDLL